MALFFSGMKCPLCKEAMLSEQPLFGTWGVWLPSDDRLHDYCDAVMHWDCYADWKHRKRFARSYFAFWIKHEETNPYWTCAYNSDSIFVTVNPKESVYAAWIHLAETGSRFDVKLNDWELWLNSDQGEALHPVEAKSLRDAKVVMQDYVPTVETLLENADFERKRPLIQHIMEERQQHIEQRAEHDRHVKQHNKQCERMMEVFQKQGMTCSHCGQNSTAFRLSRRSGHQSLIICKNCDWVVDMTSET